MDKVYTFLIGLSLGLSASFFWFGKFWLGILAGIPIGAMLLVIFFVMIVGLAEGTNEQHSEHWGDGWKN